MDGADFFFDNVLLMFPGVGGADLLFGLHQGRVEAARYKVVSLCHLRNFVIFVILLSSLFTRSNLIWSGQFLPLSFCCRYLCDLCHHNCVLAILLSSLLSSSLSSLVHTIEECKQLIVTSSLPSNWFTQELTTSQQPGTETSMKSLFSSGFPGKIWTLKCPHIILPFPNNIIIILITNVLVIKYWLTWQLWGFSNVLIFCHQILIILKSQISSSSF